MTATAVSTTKTLTLAGVGPIEVTVEEQGTGPAFLVLHGGAGPQSVAGFAQLLAEKGTRLAITPTHPGFGGTPRPDGLNSVAGLAALYVGLLDELELNKVTVVGNSVGGWIAVEMALLESGRISRLVLLDAVGIEVEKDTPLPTSPGYPCPRSRCSHSTTRRPSVSISPLSPTHKRQSLLPTAQPWLSIPVLQPWPTRRCWDA